MDDLEKRIQETVSRKMNDGTIEKMIEEQMEKAVKTALDDVFGYSGNGRKLLKGYGIELNSDYFRDGVGYLQEAERDILTPTLFDFLGVEE